MASTATLLAQLKVAEAQEAKARTEEAGLRAALGRCRAARAEWSRAAHLLRLQFARAARRQHLGVAVSRRAPFAAAPKTPAHAAAQPSRRPVGRPRIAGCFQCRFLARGGAVGRRGGKAHTCGGPASAEYQRWARVRVTERALTLAGRRVTAKPKQAGTGVPVKRKTKRGAGARR